MNTAPSVRSLFELKFQVDTSATGDRARNDCSQCDVQVVLSASAAKAVDAGVWRPRYRDEDLAVEDVDDGDWLRISYRDGATFVLTKDGSEIRTAWTPPLTSQDVETYLFGPIVGLLLYLRGVTCLHASAIAYEGKALVFAGAAEAGKSTIAAAFARNGCRALTDDILALDRRSTGIAARPGVPRIGLWPQAVECLWGYRDALPRQVPTWEKCFLDLAAHDLFQESPLPVGAVYLLADREPGRSPQIESVGGLDAVLALIANKYVTRVSEPEQDKRDFVLLCELAASVPVRRIARSDRLADLNSTCEAILADYESRVLAAA